MNEPNLCAEEPTSPASTRLLGIFSMIAAPALSAGQMIFNAGPDGPGENQIYTSAMGVLYLAGIGAGAIAMRRCRVTGNGLGAAVLFAVQMIGLVLASGCDIIEYAAPQIKDGWLFFVTDIAYPFSHVLWVAVGFAVVKARVWRGWRVAVPFVAGLALPAFFLTLAVTGRRELGGPFFIVGTTLGFFLLGLAVTTWDRPPAPAVPRESPQPLH